MSVSVVYWSGTGNTQAMAEAVAEGIRAAGQEAAVLEVSAADPEGLAIRKMHLPWAARLWAQSSWKRQRWNLL